jgi:ATP adenylyltransferase
MRALFTPWRLSYVMSLKRDDAKCVFCAAQKAGDEESLILHRARHNFIILNLYPYNNGHLMIVPLRHLADPGKAEPEERAEMMELAVRCQEALEKAYGPEGFNIGMNLGRGAGAGVTDHFHLHIVPRWVGDTSFMSVFGETRVVPEDLKETLKKLKQYFNS